MGEDDVLASLRHSRHAFRRTRTSCAAAFAYKERREAEGGGGMVNYRHPATKAGEYTRKKVRRW